MNWMARAQRLGDGKNNTGVSPTISVLHSTAVELDENVFVPLTNFEKIGIGIVARSHKLVRIVVEYH